jgi:hypothetical protein
MAQLPGMDIPLGWFRARAWAQLVSEFHFLESISFAFGTIELDSTANGKHIHS